MIICTSKTCINKKVCGRQKNPDGVFDKIYDLTNSCNKVTGYDFFIHKEMERSKYDTTSSNTR